MRSYFRHGPCDERCRISVRYDRRKEHSYKSSSGSYILFGHTPNCGYRRELQRGRQSQSETHDRASEENRRGGSLTGRWISSNKRFYLNASSKFLTSILESGSPRPHLLRSEPAVTLPPSDHMPLRKSPAACVLHHSSSNDSFK